MMYHGRIDITWCIIRKQLRKETVFCIRKVYYDILFKFFPRSDTQTEKKFIFYIQYGWYAFGHFEAEKEYIEKDIKVLLNIDNILEGLHRLGVKIYTKRQRILGGVLLRRICLEEIGTGYGYSQYTTFFW